MNTSTAKTRKTWLALLAAVAAFALALCMLSGCSSEKASDTTSDARGRKRQTRLDRGNGACLPAFRNEGRSG